MHATVFKLMKTIRIDEQGLRIEIQEIMRIRYHNCADGELIINASCMCSSLSHPMEYTISFSSLSFDMSPRISHLLSDAIICVCWKPRPSRTFLKV